MWGRLIASVPFDSSLKTGSMGIPKRPSDAITLWWMQMRCAMLGLLHAIATIEPNKISVGKLFQC